MEEVRWHSRETSNAFHAKSAIPITIGAQRAAKPVDRPIDNELWPSSHGPALISQTTGNLHIDATSRKWRANGG